MKPERLTAFTDGVIAIIITIMVLELKVPHEVGLAALRQIAPTLGLYLLSFIFVAIYWNNHHHLFQAVKTVSGATLWANMHLLFWMSLLPFTTEWMGQTNFASLPVGFYGLLLIMAGLAWLIMTRTLLAIHPADSALHRALGSDKKSQLSLALYALALAISPFARFVSLAVYVAVALIWFVPDRRIERVLGSKTIIDP